MEPAIPSSTAKTGSAPGAQRASGGRRFSTLAWSLLGYNLLVIAWGAYVRASGSGAGCGAHWPLCNGEVIPRAPGIEMLVELSHRLTSGLALIFNLGLGLYALRVYPPRHRVRRGVWAAFGFVCAEALIGAGLVFFELVAHDASTKRALSMALHLTNTFFLVGALTLTAFWASGGPPSSLRRQGPLLWVLATALGAVIVVGMSGAVTALGDTLFPARSVIAGLQAELSTTAHLFVKLRLLHPLLAALTAVIVLASATAARILRGTPRVRALSHAVSVVVVIQIVCGLLNVALLAPIPMQLVHLLLADAVFILLVLLAATSLRAIPTSSDDQAPIISKNGAAPINDVPPSTSSVAPVT